MERRKDTELKSARLPREYLDMVQGVFTKNFAPHLLKEFKEAFVVFGEIYPDEVIVGISLKNPSNLRLTTCYASVDYPPAQLKLESGTKAPTNAETIRLSMDKCVDAAASFFHTFFTEGRPVDYDMEYRQNWTPLELEKNQKVFLRINRDNLELENEADLLLETAEFKPKSKKKLN